MQTQYRNPETLAFSHNEQTVGIRICSDGEKVSDIPNAPKYSGALERRADSGLRIRRRPTALRTREARDIAVSDSCLSFRLSVAKTSLKWASAG